MSVFFKFKPGKKDITFNIILILFIFFIRASVMGNYLVPTGSMNPTITEGDRFISNNIAYGIRLPLTNNHIIRWGIPDRGDIIAFTSPVDKKTNLAKRVIGVPGDRIEFNNNKIYINSRLLKRKFVSENTDFYFYEEELSRNVRYTIQKMKFRSLRIDDFALTVPGNHLFVMGDNRDNSNDSRFWGFVPVENVLGKLKFCYFSMNPETNEFRINRLGKIK
ncbi:MAG: signal peptidase I [Spirochaetes bacterium]|nr:signal peptidase I [Spirochaetota bacterium]